MRNAGVLEEEGPSTVVAVVGEARMEEEGPSTVVVVARETHMEEVGPNIVVVDGEIHIKENMVKHRIAEITEGTLDIEHQAWMDLALVNFIDLNYNNHSRNGDPYIKLM